MNYSLPTALVIDDQDDYLAKLAPSFGEPDPLSENLLPPSDGFRLKYFARPDYAIRFLDKAVRGEMNWRPDYAFIDFQFTRHQETGLSVLRALRAATPKTIPVLYLDLDATRTLFAAAAREWYSVVHVIDKTDVNPESFTQLLTGADPTPRGVSRMLRDNAHLVNDLFPSHYWAKVWMNWTSTQGNSHHLMKETGLSKNQIDGFLGAGRRQGAPEAVFRYVDAMEVKVIGEHAPAHHRDERRRQIPITDFVSRHSRFFADPMLETVVREVEPWNCRPRG